MKKNVLFALALGLVSSTAFASWTEEVAIYVNYPYSLGTVNTYDADGNIERCDVWYNLGNGTNEHVWHGYGINSAPGNCYEIANGIKANIENGVDGSDGYSAENGVTAVIDFSSGSQQQQQQQNILP